MKRSPPPKRKASLRRVSDKRAAENRARATAMRMVMKRSDGRCEMRQHIARVDPVAASDCRGRAVDGHEPKTRGRGGSITDPREILATCRQCHDWVHAHPTLATEVGLLVPSWA